MDTRKSHKKYIPSSVSIYSCLCRKCGHKWEPKGINLPCCCPKCKSRKWKEGSWVKPKENLDVGRGHAPINTVINIRSGE